MNDSRISIRGTELAKRRHSALLVLSIYSAQLATAAILNHFSLMTKHHLFWVTLYYLISFFAAVPQAGFSDESGRKKHLLIASSCILGTTIWFLIIAWLQAIVPRLAITTIPAFSILPACVVIGLLGNVIPIARGCLAALKLHNFQAAIGLTSSAIGLGWITSDFLTLALGSNGVLIFSSFLQLIVIICVKISYFFQENRTVHKKIIRKSYTWLLSILFVTGGSTALAAYLLTETTFYQIYTLDEFPSNTTGGKIIGTLMGIGYSAGVIMLWILNPSNKNSIKFGLVISFSCLIAMIICVFVFPEVPSRDFYMLRTNGVLQFLFALGFGFSVPALFSLMSNHVHPSHFGRLFGAIDSTDTAALYFSAFLLNLKTRLMLNDQIVFVSSSLLILLSARLYYKVIKVFRSYEKH